MAQMIQGSGEDDLNRRSAKQDRKLRVLVVDDSVTAQELVKLSLQADPSIEVVGVAENGVVALRMVEQHSPDAVTLDLEMPVLNGIETLKEMRQRGITIPVVIFSTLSVRGAKATLDALAAGADDYVTKPANAHDVQEAIRRISEELVPKVKALCSSIGRRVISAVPRTYTPRCVLNSNLPDTDVETLARQTLPQASRSKIQIVAIGTSTGGPNALAEVIPRIPASFPIPIVIVQHMPPMFTKQLADRLSADSRIPVEEGRFGAVLEPGRAWIAPGDQHMGVGRELASACLKIHKGPKENSCRPAVDVLFRSVAEVYGAGVLAVVMTGMGQDGLRGCEEIKAVGGQVIVQDEASSVVWGMPGMVAQAGLADRVLPLRRIAEEIIFRVKDSRSASRASETAMNSRSMLQASV